MQVKCSIERKRRGYGYAICAGIFLSYLIVYFHKQEKEQNATLSIANCNT